MWGNGVQIVLRELFLCLGKNIFLGKYQFYFPKSADSSPRNVILNNVDFDSNNTTYSLVFHVWHIWLIRIHIDLYVQMNVCFSWSQPISNCSMYKSIYITRFFVVSLGLLADLERFELPSNHYPVFTLSLVTKYFQSDAIQR